MLGTYAAVFHAIGWISILALLFWVFMFFTGIWDELMNAISNGVVSCIMYLFVPILLVTIIIFSFVLSNDYSRQDKILNYDRTTDGYMYEVKENYTICGTSWDKVVIVYTDEDDLSDTYKYGILNDEVFLISRTNSGKACNIANSEMNKDELYNKLGIHDGPINILKREVANQ